MSALAQQNVRVFINDTLVSAANPLPVDVGASVNFTTLQNLVTTLNGYVDGVEALLTTLNSLVTTQAGYLDGVEGLITTTNTKLAAATTGAITSVSSSASDGTILASNANRKAAAFYNDSTQVLYLALASVTSSSTVYTTQIAAGGYYELPVGQGGVYTGIVKGIWASANGNARVTEMV